MELVEGPTLAQRISAGPIPVEEALPIARQIADVLEAAHERGIVHRDLKPANVKFTKDGAGSILDAGGQSGRYVAVLHLTDILFYLERIV